jgi:UDP-N-acetyl-D-mannosaminuronate dehydrogenase
VFDPYVLDQSTQPDFATFLNEIDFLVVATDHDELTQLTPEELQHYGIQAIVDGKNCLDKDAIQSAGIAYTGIGR